jgi:putative spermidine/putrescine transport system permease protein
MTRRKRSVVVVPFLLLAPALLLSALFFLGPLLQALLTSLGLEEGGLSAASYATIFASRGFRTDFAFTIALGLGTVIGCTIVALPLALLLRHNFPGRWLVWLVALLPFVTPHIIAAYAVRLALSPASPLLFWLPQGGRDGIALVNAWPGLLIALIWKHYPLMLISLSAALQRLPPGVEDAARDLGAGAWRRLRTIILPLLAPGWAAGAALVLVLAMSQFTITLIVYGGQRVTTVPIDIYFETFSSRRPAIAAALGVGLLLITLSLVASSSWAVRRMSRTWVGAGGSRSSAPLELSPGPLARLGAVLLIGALFIGVLGPISSLALNSISDQWLGGTPFPSRYTLRWYAYLFRYEDGLGALGQSALFALSTAVLTTLIAVPAAYALARYRFQGREAIEALFLAKNATPVILVAVGTAALFYRWGLIDTFTGVLLAHSVGALPLALRGAVTAFEQLERAQEEAARDAGAGPWRRFRTIVLPQAAPGIAGGAALAFLFSMDEFTVTFLISGVRYTTLPLRLYSILNQGYIEAAAAAAVLLFVPALLYLLLIIRFFGPTLMTESK